jgi:replicative superfamily II helicase
MRAQDIIRRSVVEKDLTIQMNAINEAIATLHPDKTKPGQREALHRLIYFRKDLVLVASTGFGKSMILHAVSLLIQT